jgi:hypothetical protein
MVREAVTTIVRSTGAYARNPLGASTAALAEALGDFQRDAAKQIDRQAETARRA